MLQIAINTIHAERASGQARLNALTRGEPPSRPSLVGTKTQDLEIALANSKLQRMIQQLYNHCIEIQRMIRDFYK